MIDGVGRHGASHPSNFGMVCFRAILLWLMMLAVPFQGYATADFHHAEAHADAHPDDGSGGLHDAAHKCGNCAAWIATTSY
ncbi:hypothetical protein [Variovorax sp. ZT4R33]|uniref:hypothetical protein n=1 Tax=Variovorax sp. ZT4R33 TaxID=3443743 RepID=UPI003F45F275